MPRVVNHLAEACFNGQTPAGQPAFGDHQKIVDIDEAVIIEISGNDLGLASVCHDLGQFEQIHAAVQRVRIIIHSSPFCNISKFVRD
jgi:hypothetical protein